MTDAARLKVAIVGLRIHAGTLEPDRGHGLVKSFKAAPGVDVVAYCEWAPDQAAALGALGQADPAARLYTSLDELLQRESFDIAVVMLPPDEAQPTALRLLQAGKHLFIEKQAARTAAEMRLLVEAAREAGVRVQVGYPWVAHPIAQHMRRLLDEGVIGRPVDLEVRHVTVKVAPGHRDPQQWLYRRATEGGGMLHMEGGHWITLMRYLAGDEVQSVIALCSRTGVGIQDDLEDVSTVAMQFRGGLHGSLHMGYLLPLVGPRDDASVVLRGTEGTMTWRPTGEAEFTVVSATPAWRVAPVRTFRLDLAQRPVYADEWGYQFVAAFVRAVRDGGAVPVSAQDGLRFLEIVDAAYESCRSGRRVDL